MPRTARAAVATSRAQSRVRALVSVGIAVAVTRETASSVRVVACSMRPTDARVRGAVPAKSAVAFVFLEKETVSLAELGAA